jgi:hypothetical protein
MDFPHFRLFKTLSGRSIQGPICSFPGINTLPQIFIFNFHAKKTFLKLLAIL